MNTLRFFNHYIHVRALFLGALHSVVLMGSVYAAAFLRFGEGAGELAEGSVLLVVQALLFTVMVLLGMIAMGLYHSQLREGHLQIVLRLAASFAVAVVGLLIVFYVVPGLHLGRGVTALALTISFASIVVVELCAYRFAKRRPAQWNILFYGAGTQAAAIFSQLRRRSDQHFFTIYGCVPAPGEPVRIDSDLVRHVDDTLLAYARAHEIDEIVVAMDNRRENFPADELMDCRMAGINIIDELTFYERQTGKVKTELLSPGWIIFSYGFRQTRLHNAIKRGFDFVSAAIMLIVFSPVMLLTAAGILIEDGLRAPVLFSQTRVGEKGRVFRILKFRSMHVNAEQAGQAQWATTDDPRITRAGAFIRNHRFDELPQLFNVLRGEMSLVGPRPERPEFVTELAQRLPYYSVRHQVKPGITGWAQLRYPYGASEEDANAKLELDLYYVKNRSMFLDLLILLGTVEAVLFRKGAR